MAGATSPHDAWVPSSITTLRGVGGKMPQGEGLNVPKAPLLAPSLPAGAGSVGSAGRAKPLSGRLPGTAVRLASVRVPALGAQTPLSCFPLKGCGGCGGGETPCAGEGLGAGSPLPGCCIGIADLLFFSAVVLNKREGFEGSRPCWLPQPHPSSGTDRSPAPGDLPPPGWFWGVVPPKQERSSGVQGRTCPRVYLGQFA